MKTIGLIGGMSWESSIEYYRIINEEIMKSMGSTHSAKCLMHSVDYKEIEEMEGKGQWKELTDKLTKISIELKNAGADFIVICSNTMHKLADEIEKNAGIEVLNIVEVTGKEIEKKKLKKVALLGTKFTMESDFYQKLLEEKYGVETIIPHGNDEGIIHHVIYKELVKGIISGGSKKAYLNIIEKLEEDGVEGVILGCSEIPMLIQQKDLKLPVFDTTLIHAKAAVEYALE